MDQQQRRVVRAVADVHHHLRDVDGPALGEQAAGEDRPDERRAAVGVDALEVVAGDRLVDGQQPEHPVVVLAQVRLALLLGPVVGHRGDREERLLALVERPGRAEHRAAEGAQEDRRPLDLERLVGQADQVVLGAERLDPGVLGAAEVEQVVGLRVLQRDRVEDAADEAALVVRDRPAAAPRRPELAGEADHLGTDGDVLALRAGQDPLRRQGLRAHRVPHLGREQLAPEAALALAGGEDDVAQVGLEGGHRCARGLGRGDQAGLDRGHGGVGRGRLLGGGQAHRR